jgi:protein-L-isoaspartate(D-aspartate) O-methyltransferase
MMSELQLRELPNIGIAVLCVLLLAFTANADEAEYVSARAAMVDDVHFYATLARDTGEEAFNEDVMRSMGTVKRHEFVPAEEKPFAYENRPLPIGHGQTISQPYIVALMTDLIEPDSDDVVLEIGTGSGYQAAILANLVNHVYSIEIIEPLADRAKSDLERLGYENVTTKLGDGYYGWEEHAPFDAIVVTAAASHVPPPLVQQLRPGGRMIIPVGGQFMTQQLLLLEKTEDDRIITRQIAAVRFVPLTGEH